MYMCRDLRSTEDTWDCNFLDTVSPLTSVERPLPLEHCLGRVGSGWSWHGWQSHLQTSPAGILTSKPWRSDVRECQRMSETAVVDATSLDKALDKQPDTDGHMDFHQNWCWGVASPGLLQSTGQDWRYRHYTHGNSFKRYMRTTKLSIILCILVSLGRIGTRASGKCQDHDGFCITDRSQIRFVQFSEGLSPKHS